MTSSFPRSSHYFLSSLLRNFLLAKHVHHLLGFPSALMSKTRSRRRAPISLRTWVRYCRSSVASPEFLR